MSEQTTLKSMRVLSLYARLQEGQVITKSDLAQEFNVNERSIQRDIEALRDFLADEHLNQTVVYDKRAKGYCLNQTSSKSLSNSEILAVCKILLESRSLRHDEMLPILDKLVDCCVPEANKVAVKGLLSNEKYHYIAPHHDTAILPRLWELGQAVNESRYIEVDYYRTKDKQIVRRKLQPAAIMFSEYYFYLTAFIDDEKVRENFDVLNDSFPTIYRIDRIRSLKVLEERFHIPYSNRFEEGEFRKRIQFMYGGRLQKVKFRYTGTDIDAVLDRLPTAQILDEEDGGYVVSAEVFGTGINMWLRSQGDYVELIQ